MTTTADLRTDPRGSTSGDGGERSSTVDTGAEATDPRPTPATPVGPAAPAGWTRICPLERLQPERGVAALVGGEPVAVFRTRPDSIHGDRLHALHNVDPFTRASVLSRGIVGDIGGTPVVASPLHKQHFALETGAAVEDDTVAVATYPVRVVDGVVEVGSP